MLMSCSASVKLRIEENAYTPDELTRILARILVGAGSVWWDESDLKPASWKKEDDVHWSFCQRCQKHHDARVLDQRKFDKDGIKAEELDGASSICHTWKYKVANAAALIYTGEADFEDAPYAQLFEVLAARAPLLTFSIESVAHDVGPTYRAKYSRGLMMAYQESRMVREWLPESVPDATEQLNGLVRRTCDDAAWEQLLVTHAKTLRSIVSRADWKTCNAIEAGIPPEGARVLARIASLRAIKDSVPSSQ
jgi:hypothetical protein